MSGSGTPRDEIPDRIRFDLRDVADALANRVVREVFVPGRAVGAQKRVEQGRERHPGESRLCLLSRPITTDLLTPLGAYLRLRQSGRASFLLESVEQGRLGRHSFIGGGSRLVSFEEAETLDVPVVGYLAYDHVAKLEPTVPLPEEGPDLPESRFVAVDTLVRFDHGSGTASVLAGDETEIAARLGRDIVLQQHKLIPNVGAKRGDKDLVLLQHKVSRFPSGPSTRTACGGSRS